MKKAVLNTLTACVVIGTALTTSAGAQTIKCTPKLNYSGYVKTYYVCQKPNGGTLKPGIDTQKPGDDALKPGTGTQTPDSDVQTDLEYARAVLNLVNKERTSRGLSALILDEGLSNVAQKHSKDMAENNYFSHTNLAGESPFDRIKKAGISYRTAGENIAAGQKTPEAVVSSWMNSEGHRKNILNASFNKMGLGYVTANSGYKTYWTQVFTD